MTRRLVRSGVKAEVNHMGTIILGSDDVVSTVLPRLVRGEERLRRLREDGDTVGGDLKGIDRLLRLSEGASAALNTAVQHTRRVSKGLLA